MCKKKMSREENNKFRLSKISRYGILNVLRRYAMLTSMYRTARSKYKNRLLFFSTLVLLTLNMILDKHAMLRFSTLCGLLGLRSCCCYRCYLWVKILWFFFFYFVSKARYYSVSREHNRGQYSYKKNKKREYYRKKNFFFIGNLYMRCENVKYQTYVSSLHLINNIFFSYLKFHFSVFKCQFDGIIRACKNQRYKYRDQNYPAYDI